MVSHEGVRNWRESYAGVTAAGLRDRETGQRVESRSPIPP